MENVYVDDDTMERQYIELENLMKYAMAANGRFQARENAVFEEGYRLAMEKHNCRAYRRPSPKSKHDDILILGLTNCKLDDIGYALYSESSQATRTINSFLYGNEFIDGGILQTNFLQNLEDPYRFFGVKNSILQMMSSTLFKPREAVFVESMGTTYTPDGRPVLYSVRRSIDVPTYTGTPGCVRMDIQFTHLFVELPTRQVQYYVVLSTDPNGNFPAWIYNKRSAKVGQVMDTMNQLAQIRRLIAAPPAYRIPVSPTSVQKCGVCPRKSRKWRWCRTCGQITCTICAFHVSKPGHLLRASQARPAAFSTSSSDHDPSKAKTPDRVKEDYCKKCFHKAQNPQAFKPQVLFGCDLTGEYSAVQGQTRTGRANSSSLATKPTSKIRTESGDSYTSYTSSTSGRRTPSGPSRILQSDFNTPRPQKKLERAASDGNLLQTAKSYPAEDGKLDSLEETSGEFNPDLYESLEYQRKLLADMQALIVSQKSLSAETA